MKVMRHVGFMIVLSGIMQSAFGDLPRRPMSGATPAPAAAASGPTRPAPPARMAAPYKPIELSNPVAGLQQSTVRWKIPDQGDGRLIEQWLVRACPQVNGTPYAACQQVQQLNGPDGQASGTYVQAQIPAHVLFMGADTPVNGAEICSVNSAGTSCADRIAVRFINPGIAPAPAKLHGAAGGAPSGMPLGATGIAAAPQGEQGPAGATHPGTTRGIIVVPKQPTTQQTPEHVMSAGTDGGSPAKKPAIATTVASLAQPVHTAQIAADGTGAALSASIIPGLVHTIAIAADGTGTALSASVVPGLVHTSAIAADGTGAALSASIIPGLVHTSAIAADGTGTLTSTVLRPSLRLK